jgi:hypothetical protein
VANAHFKVGGQTIDVFGPRAEQVAHLLELDGGRKGKKLAYRIGSHVADEEPGDDVLDLSEDEQHVLLEALEKVAGASHSEPPDLRKLRGALSEPGR